MTNWQELRIDDLGKVVTGKTPTTSKPEFYGGETQFLTPTDMDGRRTIDKTLRYLSNEGVNKVHSSLLPKGSISVSCIGSDMGKAVIVGSKTITNQQINSIIVNDEFDNLFVYYNLSGRKDEIQFLASGAAQPIMNKTDFSNLPINVPNIKNQKAIASVLSALDDKIENNRRMNETLEEMARAIFKSWFVDFDPVHAKAAGNAPVHMDADTAALFPNSFADNGLPVGWAFKTLGNLVENHSTTYNFTNKNDVIFINTGDVLEGNFLHNKKTMVQGLPGQAKKSIRRGDILYSEIRPKNKRFAFVNIDAKDYVVSTKFMVLRKVSKTSSFYIYVALKQPDAIKEFNMIAESRSGTFPQITFDAIKHFPIVESQKGVADKFDEIYGAFFQKQEQLRDENKTLAELRDTLLPKLMSGEIRVKDAEREVEAAV